MVVGADTPDGQVGITTVGSNGSSSNEDGYTITEGGNAFEDSGGNGTGGQAAQGTLNALTARVNGLLQGVGGVGLLVALAAAWAVFGGD